VPLDLPPVQLEKNEIQDKPIQITEPKSRSDLSIPITQAGRIIYNGNEAVLVTRDADLQWPSNYTNNS
jgi:hypothetical protein